MASRSVSGAALQGDREAAAPPEAGRRAATDAIWAAMQSAGKAMMQPRMHEALCRRAGVDLDRAGAGVLYALQTGGDGSRLTDLAERLGVDSPGVTRKVQQLERAGLVSRSPDPDDARAARLHLTRDGRHALERLLRARADWLEELLAGWSDRDRRSLARLLDQFAATLLDHIHHGDAHGH